MVDDAASKEGAPVVPMENDGGKDDPKDIVNKERVDESIEAKEETEKPSRVAAPKDAAAASASSTATTAPTSSAATVPPLNMAPSVPPSSTSAAATTTGTAQVLGSSLPAAATTTKVPAEPTTQHPAPRALVPPPNKPVAPPTNLNTLTKKRKLDNSPPPVAVVPSRPRPPPTSSTRRPLIDPLITKTVHDIMGLLQTYGPLSLAQLEYNLPPCNSLQDVLQVMVTLGVVQVVDDRASTLHRYATKYCMAYGKPRADIVTPPNLVTNVLQAQEEMVASEQRCNVLKQALQATTPNTVATRQLLKSLLLKNPQVANDPVYMAAFRNFHVDIAGVERERLKQERTTFQMEKSYEPKEKTMTEGGKSTPQLTAGKSMDKEKKGGE